MSTEKVKVIALKDIAEPHDFPENTAWCVYWYERGSYEGSGSAYCGTRDGKKFYHRGLGHCSCYGPWDPSEKQWYEIDRGELDLYLAGKDENDEEAKALRKAIHPLLKKGKK